jgi:anionic cell wall polymer biosynthesis LytR-Cps2A-Psr (LCP) family protein
MFRLSGLTGKSLAGMAVYALSCAAAALVLLVAGVSYYSTKAVNSIGTSNVDAGGPSTGPMNILLMGLESRTYWDGTSVDHHIATVLHIGTATDNNGGNAANTLILLHVFAGGQKAVGFSIPRDDYVEMVGTLGFGPKMSKIDNAYGYAMYQQEYVIDPKAHPNWTAAQRSFDGNEAGRLAEIETVEALTGVHVDKFAELNLVGFYQMAQVFGGSEVCVLPWPGGESTTGYIPKNGNLHDPVVYELPLGWQGSGSVVKSGIQHLSPEQTLAFVRNRHELPGGDIARTYRQQAIIQYVIGNLKTNGVLSDVSKLTSLVSSASKYLAVPKSWDLVQFGGELDALTGKNLSITTLSETAGPNIPGIGDVDNVNIPAIQSRVQRAFAAPRDGITTPAPSATAGTHASAAPKTSTTPKAPKPAATPVPPALVTVNVTNSGAPTGSGGRVQKALVAKGYHAQAGSPETGTTTQALTTVTYGAGAAANAAEIAKLFGGDITATPDGSLPADHVQITLGVATQMLPPALDGPTTAATPTTPPPSSNASISDGSVNPYSLTPTEKQWVAEAKAKYGIPCVY